MNKERKPAKIKINYELLEKANAAADAAEKLKKGELVHITQVLGDKGLPDRLLTRDELPLVEEIADLRIKQFALGMRTSRRGVKTSDII